MGSRLQNSVLVDGNASQMVRPCSTKTEFCKPDPWHRNRDFINDGEELAESRLVLGTRGIQNVRGDAPSVRSSEAFGQASHAAKEEAMSASYEKFGVRFLYPENWAVAEEQLNEWPRSVSVQSPTGAYWELQVYPSRMSPVRLTNEVLEAMRQIYTDIESKAVTEDLWSVTAKGYDLDFFCLDFLITCSVRCFRVGSRTCLLTCQAESREFESQQAVFAAITKSLLDNA